MVHTTAPDGHLDLPDARSATLSTVGEDGYPQLSGVWFVAEGGEINLSLNTAWPEDMNG